jgi:hypothetical protein
MHCHAGTSTRSATPLVHDEIIAHFPVSEIHEPEEFPLLDMDGNTKVSSQRLKLVNDSESVEGKSNL